MNMKGKYMNINELKTLLSSRIGSLTYDLKPLKKGIEVACYGTIHNPDTNTTVTVNTAESEVIGYSCRYVNDTKRSTAPRFRHTLSGYLHEIVLMLEDKSNDDGKNELMINYGNGYVYFKTEADTAQAAISEYLEKLHSIGVNDDNLTIKFATLRDTSYSDIDTYAA